jgi:hypothetical protein
MSAPGKRCSQVDLSQPCCAWATAGEELSRAVFGMEVVIVDMYFLLFIYILVCM